MMSTPIYKYAIVGFGIAGQLLALELLKRVSPKDTIIFDKDFLGGALATEYATVISNTPWFKTKTALQQYPEFSAEAIQDGDSKYPETVCMPIGDIAKYCLSTATKAVRAVDKLTSEVESISMLDESVYELKHTFGKSLAQTVFLCTGAKEKILDFELPRIPLSIALDKASISRFVEIGKDHVVVFGTAHSGTIVLDNLNDLNIQTTAIYHGAEPFRYARDGAYDGIKEGSEKIADAIRLGRHSNLTLVSLSDISTVYKHLKKATKAIYCTGFDKLVPGHVDHNYDAQTAAVGTTPRVYGYGIAYPGKSVVDGKEYVDVSVLSFQEQIQRTLPAILEKSCQ
jgi:hypothetical protein